jgi:hypothetical protein
MPSTVESEPARVTRSVEDGAVVLRERLGSIRIEQLAGDVVLSTLTGRHTHPLAMAMSAELDAILTSGRTRAPRSRRLCGASRRP